MPPSQPESDVSPRLANQRGAARLAAVQALYQMDVGRQSLEDTLSQIGRASCRERVSTIV